jgi:NitT/TauT family transport system permease protein
MFAAAGRYERWILPAPPEVAGRFVEVARSGALWAHTQATLIAAVSGFLTGFAAAVVAGYGLAKSERLERLVSPFIVASQAVPIVALAPILILWFGFGLRSRILVAALIVFFPILVNTVVGMRSVDPRKRELMAALSASAWQVFVKLELPSALPVILAGTRVGITLAVIGAVVGELVASRRGLGTLIGIARGGYDTALVYVAVFTLMALALTLYSTVVLVERLTLRRPPGAT